jgi:hypothetical protein
MSEKGASELPVAFLITKRGTFVSGGRLQVFAEEVKGKYFLQGFTITGWATLGVTSENTRSKNEPNITQKGATNFLNEL